MSFFLSIFGVAPPAQSVDAYTQAEWYALVADEFNLTFDLDDDNNYDIAEDDAYFDVIQACHDWNVIVGEYDAEAKVTNVLVAKSLAAAAGLEGVKDADGNESIALRYKFQRRRPFGKEVTLSKTLLNIYNVGDNAVWVEANLTRDLNHPEMNRIVDAVIKLIGAQATEDPCVYAIPSDEINQLKQDVKGNESTEGGEKKEEESYDKQPDPNAAIAGSLQQDNKQAQ